MATAELQAADLDELAEAVDAGFKSIEACGCFLHRNLVRDWIDRPAEWVKALATLRVQLRGAYEGISQAFSGSVSDPVSLAITQASQGEPIEIEWRRTTVAVEGLLWVVEHNLTELNELFAELKKDSPVGDYRPHRERIIHRLHDDHVIKLGCRGIPFDELRARCRAEIAGARKEAAAVSVAPKPTPDPTPIKPGRRKRIRPEKLKLTLLQDIQAGCDPREQYESLRDAAQNYGCDARILKRVLSEIKHPWDTGIAPRIATVKDFEAIVEKQTAKSHRSA